MGLAGRASSAASGSVPSSECAAARREGEAEGGTSPTPASTLIPVNLSLGLAQRNPRLGKPSGVNTILPAQTHVTTSALPAGQEGSRQDKLPLGAGAGQHGVSWYRPLVVVS